MSEQDNDHGSRIGRIETDLDRLTETLEGVVQISASTSADIRNLTKQVGNLFHRSNRPVEWAALVAAIGLLFVGASLLITPIKGDIDEIKTSHEIDNRDLKEFNTYVIHHLEKDAYEMGQMGRDIEWLKDSAEKLSDRIHRRYINAGD